MTVPYTFGNESSPIPLSQLDANFAVTPVYANTAGNVTNSAQANITSVGTLTSLSVAGNINAGNINFSSASVTGNVAVGNLLTNGAISAYGTVTGGAFSTTGNLSVGNVIATVDVSSVGNVIGGNIVTGGNVSATGDIYAQGTISATGNVETAQYFVGNFLGNITGNLSVGGSNTQVLFNLSGNVGAAGGLTYNKDSNVLTVLGNVSAQGNVITGNVVSSGGQFTGVVTAPTPSNGTSNNQIATTAFVNSFVGSLGTMASQNAVSVAITGGTIGNVNMNGLITAPTPVNGTSNTQVATTAFVFNNAIPSGFIGMWSGSVGSIPTGWYLCNGLNGTPNLVDRFVIGAGSTYNVGNIGGSTDSVVVSHTHTITDPGHAHTYGPFPPQYYVGGGGYFAGIQGSVPTTTTTATTGITIDSAGVSGTNANLPPYYALCFIMKA